MAYGTDCLSAQSIVDYANRDTNRLVGTVAMYLAKRSPYLDTIDGGTLENVSETVRSAVAEQAMPAASMVRPVFGSSLNACGTGGGVDSYGSTEFSYSLGNLRGRGPKICVKTTRTAFKSAYPAALNSLRQVLLGINNADVRANYLDNGGLKLSMDSTGTFAQDFSGAINTIPGAGAGYPNRTPDSPPSFRAIEYLMTYMRETLNVQPFDDEGEGYFKCIFGQDIIQGFRDELDIREDVRALTTGRYRMGEDTISGYRFKGPYHAMAFGVDPTPLRFTTITSGVPTLIEPLTATAVTTSTSGDTQTYAARPNASWTGATYEIGFVFGQSSFKRLVPSYQKVAGYDFSEQLVNGGLQFKLLQDADCNLFGDYGVHIYEIERAFMPMVPHAVCAVIYKRPGAVLNLTPV